MRYSLGKFLLVLSLLTTSFCLGWLKSDRELRRAAEQADTEAANHVATLARAVQRERSESDFDPIEAGMQFDAWQHHERLQRQLPSSQPDIEPQP